MVWENGAGDSAALDCIQLSVRWMQLQLQIKYLVYGVFEPSPDVELIARDGVLTSFRLTAFLCSCSRCMCKSRWPNTCFGISLQRKIARWQKTTRFSLRVVIDSPFSSNKPVDLEI